MQWLARQRLLDQPFGTRREAAEAPDVAAVHDPLAGAASRQLSRLLGCPTPTG